jgi:hypothetical protein
MSKVEESKESFEASAELMRAESRGGLEELCREVLGLVSDALPENVIHLTGFGRAKLVFPKGSLCSIYYDLESGPEPAKECAGKLAARISSLARSRNDVLVSIPRELEPAGAVEAQAQANGPKLSLNAARYYQIADNSTVTRFSVLCGFPQADAEAGRVS